jgi:hypothetical protein
MAVEFTQRGQCLWIWLPSRYQLQDFTSEPHPLPVGCYARVSNCCVNQDSSVDIVTRLQAKQTGGWIPNKGKRSFSSPNRPDWIWGPPSLLCNGYWGSSRRYSGGGVKLTTYLHLASRLRMCGAMSLLPLYAFMTCTGTACIVFNSDFCSEGATLAQLVEALRFKPEGRGFDSRWCHWNFSLTYSLRPHYVCWVDSASNKWVPGIFPGG